MIVHHETVDYDLADVDLTYTLEQLRDALANDCGSFKVFDDGEWKIMSRHGVGGRPRRASRRGRA